MIFMKQEDFRSLAPENGMRFPVLNKIPPSPILDSLRRSGI